MLLIDSYKLTKLISVESWQVLLIFWYWAVSRNKGIHGVTTLLSLLLFLLVKLSLSLCSRETKAKKGWPAKVQWQNSSRFIFPPFVPLATPTSFQSLLFHHPSPARVWQVPGGESQSCRDDARHAVAPQWWAGCSAGNPEAQEGGEAGRVAAGHVELQDASIKCAASLRTNWRDPKNILHLSETSQHYLFSHCRDLYTISFVKKKTKKKTRRKLMEIKRIYWWIF